MHCQVEETFVALYLGIDDCEGIGARARRLRARAYEGLFLWEVVKAFFVVVLVGWEQWQEKRREEESG